MKRILAVWGSVWIVACGGAPLATETETSGLAAKDVPGAFEEVETASSESMPEQAVAPVAPKVISGVTRAELDDFLEAGVQPALAQVQLDSVMSNGRFVGHRIVGFRSGHQSVLGLQVDDVLIKVNDLPVARPDQLSKIFQKLRTASVVSFHIIRNGENRRLVSQVQ